VPVLTALDYLALAEAALMEEQTTSSWVAIEILRKARELMVGGQEKQDDG
jgi:hypothetical protein